MAELYRYACFISYSSKDADFARRLHRALEGYTIPKALGIFDLIGGGRKNRIYPVFRDREELSAGHLSELIEASLKASAALIVVCSPNGAASPWVEKEIDYFVNLGRRGRVFAIISDDAPLTGEAGGDCTPTFFPPAFRSNSLANVPPLEPLAADARRSKDGFRTAWLKLVAGLIGVNTGALINRDRQRQRTRQLQLAFVSAVALVLVGLAGAVVDTLNWRTELSTVAEGLAGEGRALEALPFALGGQDLGGSLLSVKSPRAGEQLTPLAEVRLVRDFGPTQFFRMAPAGPVIVVWKSDGSANYYDLRAPFSGRSLGPTESFSYAQLSENGASMVIPDRSGLLVEYDLANGGTTRDWSDLGLILNYSISPDGGALAAINLEGDVFVLDLATGAPPAIVRSLAGDLS